MWHMLVRHPSDGGRWCTRRGFVVLCSDPLVVSLLAGGSARTILAGGVAFGWGHRCMLVAP